MMTSLGSLINRCDQDGAMHVDSECLETPTDAQAHRHVKSPCFHILRNPQFKDVFNGMNAINACNAT